MALVAHLLHQGSDHGGFQAFGGSQVQGRSGGGRDCEGDGEVGCRHWCCQVLWMVSFATLFIILELQKFLFMDTSADLLALLMLCIMYLKNIIWYLNKISFVRVYQFNMSFIAGDRTLKARRCLDKASPMPSWWHSITRGTSLHFWAIPIMLSFLLPFQQPLRRLFCLISQQFLSRHQNDQDF